MDPADRASEEEAAALIDGYLAAERKRAEEQARRADPVHDSDPRANIEPFDCAASIPKVGGRPEQRRLFGRPDKVRIRCADPSQS